MSERRQTVRVHALVDTLGAGGAELLAADFASVAPGAGIEFSVGALRGDRDSPAAKRLLAVGLEPEVVEVNSLMGRIDRRRVRDHVKAVAPDLLHTHLGYADMMGGAAARRLGIPTVSTIHADWWGGPLAERVKVALMARSRRRCAARVIAVSEAARRAYLDRGWDRPERVVVLRNGSALKPAPGAGRAVRDELGVGLHDLMVTMVSRLGPEKAHDVAITAVARLRGRYPRLRLVIAGDGECRDEIERAAAAAGDAVVVAGHRDDVAELLDASDVLLHPSRFDAFPTALLEAMAASVPVVASAVGGISEIVEDGRTGVLVAPPPEPERLAGALAPLLTDPARRAELGREGRRRLERDFDPRTWAYRTRAVYDEVLAGTAPRA